MHGQSGNPLYEIARHNGLVKEGFEHVVFENHDLEERNIAQIDPSQINRSSILKDFDVKTNQEKILFVTQDGKKISLEFAKSVYDTLTKIILSAELVGADKLNSNKESRVADYIYDKFAEIVRKELGKDLLDKSNFNEADFRRILHALFLQRIKREHIRSGCPNLFNLSLKNFSCYQEFKGHSYVELSKGFFPVLEAAMGESRYKFYTKVKCRHFVKKIILSQSLFPDNKLYDKEDVHARYTNDKKKAVLIVCDATDPQNPQDFVVICDNVLCTMSLGFLKENLNTIFEPFDLVTQEKRLAIQRLGFGIINKIFLFYDQPFWNNKLELINVCWVPEDDNFRLDKVAHRNAPRKLWFEDISKFEVVNSYPNAISAWIAGSEDFEKLDDASIAQECTRLLRKFLNNPNIPEPTLIKRQDLNFKFLILLKMFYKRY
jgi:hypothetical protein